MHEPIMTVDAEDVVFLSRRCFPRRTPRGTATLKTDVKPTTPCIRISMRNISRGGICFVVGQKLAVGQRITINLQALALLKPLTIQAEVRWVGCDTKPGEFRVGCSWVERLLYAHMIHFV